MAPDPNEPGRKAIFKVNTGKLPYSENTPEGCAYCLAKRPPGGKPLYLCAGCGGVRFCSREHQVKFWPSHKAFCKQQQKVREAMEQHAADGPQHPCGMPSLQERRYILEDWNELQRRSIEQAMASINRVTPIDFRTQYAYFTLMYRPESGGNPSSAFVLQSISILDDPEPGTPMSPNFQTCRRMTEKSAADFGFKPGEVDYLLCHFVFDNDIRSSWLTARAISKNDLQELPENKHRDWFIRLKYLADKGLIYRIVGPGKGQWVPGLMERHNPKYWVWKQRTLEQLADRDIHLPSA